MDARLAERHADTARPVGARARKVAARREAFLAAAARVLAMKGLRDVTMDEVAAEAGVSKVVLYRYFASKEALTEGVLEDVASLLERRLAEPWTGYGSGMAEMLAVARSRPDAFATLVSAARGDGRYGAYHRRVHEAIQLRVRQAVGEEGDLPAPLAAMSAGAVATLALDSVAAWVAEGEPSDDAAFLAWYATATRALDEAWRGGAAEG